MGTPCSAVTRPCGWRPSQDQRWPPCGARRQTAIECDCTICEQLRLHLPTSPGPGAGAPPRPTGGLPAAQWVHRSWHPAAAARVALDVACTAAKFTARCTLKRRRQPHLQRHPWHRGAALVPSLHLPSGSRGGSSQGSAQQLFRCASPCQLHALLAEGAQRSLHAQVVFLCAAPVLCAVPPEAAQRPSPGGGARGRGRTSLSSSCRSSSSSGLRSRLV